MITFTSSRNLSPLSVCFRLLYLMTDVVWETKLSRFRVIPMDSAHTGNLHIQLPE